MTNPDYRALCVELTDCLEKADWPHRYRAVFQQWADISRAALAESDGPAVPEGREPASVAMQPSDEEIMGLMPQQMHDDLAAAVRAMAEKEGIDSTPAKGVMRIILNRHVVDLARAALDRWGTPNQAEIGSSLGAAPAPVPVTPMTNLSPAAQAVLDAFLNTLGEEPMTGWNYGRDLAAALRAAADHIDHDWSGFNCVDALCEIAAELEGV